MWVYPPNCRTKVGARWSPSFPRQSLARRRARNIVQVHAHALNGSWECYHVVRIGLGAIWCDHGRRRSLHFTWVYPLLSISLIILHIRAQSPAALTILIVPSEGRLMNLDTETFDQVLCVCVCVCVYLFFKLNITNRGIRLCVCVCLLNYT